MDGDYIWVCKATEGYEVTRSTKNKKDPSSIYQFRGQLHDDKGHTNRMYSLKDAFHAKDKNDNIEAVKNVIRTNLEKKVDPEERKEYIQRTCETYYNQQMLEMSQNKVSL